MTFSKVWTRPRRQAVPFNLHLFSLISLPPTLFLLFLTHRNKTTSSSPFSLLPPPNPRLFQLLSITSPFLSHPSPSHLPFHLSPPSSCCSDPVCFLSSLPSSACFLHCSLISSAWKIHLSVLIIDKETVEKCRRAPRLKKQETGDSCSIFPPLCLHPSPVWILLFCSEASCWRPSQWR